MLHRFNNVFQRDLIVRCRKTPAIAGGCIVILSVVNSLVFYNTVKQIIQPLLILLLVYLVADSFVGGIPVHFLRHSLRVTDQIFPRIQHIPRLCRNGFCIYHISRILCRKPQLFVVFLQRGIQRFAVFLKPQFSCRNRRLAALCAEIIYNAVSQLTDQERCHFLLVVVHACDFALYYILHGTAPSVFEVNVHHARIIAHSPDNFIYAALPVQLILQRVCRGI